VGGHKGWGLGLCLAAVLVGAVLGSRSAAPIGAPVAIQPSTTTRPTTDSLLSVHVSGWVVSPGVVTVQDGAIVADAVAAAGGAKPGAALDAINLAGPVADGDQVQVPGPGSVAAPLAAEATGSSGLVSLNRADAVTLQGLPGVGPVLAERIVAYRESNGPFETVEDLLDVPGIGEAKLAALRDLVSVP
jgi:competence protein ComEA